MFTVAVGLYYFPKKRMPSVKSWIKKFWRTLLTKQNDVCDLDQKMIDVFPLNTSVDFGSVLIEKLFRLCLV